MKGYEIKFNVFASSQEEADKAAEAIRRFVDDKARLGIPVTAEKIAVAVDNWKDNYFVNRYFGYGRKEMRG